MTENKRKLKRLLESKINKSSLVAKWMPRPNGNKENKRLANAIRKHMGLSPKVYRKMLSEASNTVEQLMCAKEWDNINFSHVPSKAMSDYNNAFNKNASDTFLTYLDSVVKGEAKINASAVYPYDIVKNARHGLPSGANVQWDALPNYMEGNKERVLPLIDVSGSMGCAAGNNPNVTCLDVAISLGLYISERNIGPFKDAFMTFTTIPKLEVLKGNLSERYNQLSRADWCMSTDIELAFKTLLTKAKQFKVSQDEMPTMILILSDMEFNQATGSNGGYYSRSESNWDPTAQEMIRKMYEDAGYETPKVVYWNIHHKSDNKPVSFNETDTALVSGFSPALLTNLLSGGNLTPYDMMLNIVDSERYAPVTV